MFDKKAMELLLQGKQIRDVNWQKGEYMFLNADGKLESEDNELISYLDINTEYKEYNITYVDFFTMIKHVLNGGKAKRKHWLGSICFKNIHYPDKTLVFEEPFPNEVLQFDMRDIEATDWILL
jgi:hypothetical protein